MPAIELDDDSESSFHTNEISLCHGELVFHDFQSQHVTWMRRHVNLSRK